MATVVEMNVLRILPVLLLAIATLSVPVQASPQVPPLDIEGLIGALQKCLESGDPELCKQEVEHLVGYFCGPSAEGCFLCLNFVPSDDTNSFMPDLSEIALPNPFGKVLVSIPGASYESRSHEKVQSGVWEVRWSTSHEISCEAQTDAGE